jgi:hypothetical protein
MSVLTLNGQELKNISLQVEASFSHKKAHKQKNTPFVPFCGSA